MIKWMANNYFFCHKIFIFGIHLLEAILKVTSTCNLCPKHLFMTETSIYIQTSICIYARIDVSIEVNKKYSGR